jgi:hypothetical protein
VLVLPVAKSRHGGTLKILDQSMHVAPGKFGFKFIKSSQKIKKQGHATLLFNESNVNADIISA